MNIKIDYYKYTIIKNVSDLARLNLFISSENSILRKPNHIDQKEDELIFNFEEELTQSELNILTDFVNNYTDDPINAIRSIVDSAITFGNQVMREFIIENVTLGITQRGLTSHVRRVTSDLIQCLTTGSLYDAIAEVKMIDPNDLDSVILSEARLLIFRNKIHTYLGIPAATTWNE